MSMLTLPRVAAVDALPDGRHWVVFDDGREVVVGRAHQPPHPVPGCEWLGAHRAQPRLPRRRRCSPPTPPRRPIRILPDAREALPRRARREVDPQVAARAEALLTSLLDPLQLSDWQSNGGFWVSTPRGSVRLGRLYELAFRPLEDPAVEQILCVVPDDYLDLPIDDIWSNLLLVLAVEPEAFFRVAVHRGTRRRQLRT